MPPDTSAPDANPAPVNNAPNTPQKNNGLNAIEKPDKWQGGQAYRVISTVFPFLTWIALVRSQSLKLDCSAAITSAIFALPQGIAFALIAGLPPEFGLYAAIVAPIVSALFGSSWHAVSGPTVATSVVIISILSEYATPQSPQFIGTALILTLLAGLIQLSLGVFRLGHIVDFISHTVILGFSTGAAIIIMSSQLNGILGLSLPREGNLAISLLNTYDHLDESNLSVLLLSASTMIVALLCRHFFKRWPYLLIAMVYGAIVAMIMALAFDIKGLNMVGALPEGLPNIAFPELTLFQARELFSSAIAIATLGLIQSVSISRTIATKTGQRIDANQEFISQGLANVACSCNSGFFSSGSFTRTAVNHAAGAVTPLSSIMASGFIILFLAFGTGITAYLPTAAMSAVILLIGWGLIDSSHIKKIFQTSRIETAIFFITLLSTLLLSLEFAIYSGMFISLIIYLQKTSQPEVTKLMVDTLDPYHRLIPVTRRKSNPNPEISIIRVEGSIFFGSASHIRTNLENKGILKRRHILLICDNVNLIDIAGAELLLFLRNICHKNGGDFYLSGLTPEVRKYLLRSPYWKQLGGTKNIFNYQSNALNHITHLIEEKHEADKQRQKQETDKQILTQT